MQCDDPSCAAKTREAPDFISGRTIRCTKCTGGQLNLMVNIL